MNLILHQGEFRLFRDLEQFFLIIRDVAFKTVRTNINTIVILAASVIITIIM
jgi:hypothetical protein